MKPSRYNHFIPRPDGRVLAFNAHSGGLAIMEGEKYRLFQRLADGEAPFDPGDGEDEELLKDLRRGRFLIDDDTNELEQLELANQMAKFGSKSLGLTLAPTLDCNLRCTYCYEEQKRSAMDRESADKIFAFIQKRITALASLNLCWYGGEPLLVADRLFDLSSRIIDLCNEKDCRFRSTIVTNGYLLDREMAERLKKSRVEYAQVTLDGPRDIHDARRPFVDGSGTFDVILENIGQVADILPVNLRINVDQTNHHRVAELLDTLIDKGLRDRILLYFGQIQASTSVCQNVAEDCLDNRAFSLSEIELFREALDRGFLVRKIPRPTPAFCGAVRMNSFLIDPSGLLYKCWHDASSPEKSLGPIDKTPDVGHPNLYPWLTWNPFKNKQCRTCNILPICMGGCPHLRLGNGKPSTTNCSTWRYNLNQMLELIFQSRVREIEAKKAREQAKEGKPVL